MLKISIKWKIKHIFAGEYGCEESTTGDKPEEWTRLQRIMRVLSMQLLICIFRNKAEKMGIHPAHLMAVGMEKVK